MCRLIWYEGKKIWHNGVTWFLFGGMVLACGFLFPTIEIQGGVDSDGKERMGQDATAYVSEIKSRYANEMDAAWYEAVEQGYVDAMESYITAYADREQNELVYGPTWKQDFMAQPASYVLMETSEASTHEKGQRMLYMKDQFPRSLTYETMKEIYEYGQQIQHRQWNMDASLSIDPIDSKKQMLQENLIALPIPQEQAAMRSDLNEQEHFYYGDATGWEQLLRNLSSGWFFLPLFFCMIASSMFNKERAGNLYECMKTTKYGKRRIALAKIIVAILSAVWFVSLYAVVCVMHAQAQYGLSSGQQLVSAITHEWSAISVAQVSICSFYILLLGSVITALVATLFSCLIPSSRSSLMLSVLVTIAPYLIPTIQKEVFPIRFMAVYHSVVENLQFPIGTQWYSVTSILTPLWLPILMIVMAMIYWYHQRYHHV